MVAYIHVGYFFYWGMVIMKDVLQTERLRLRKMHDDDAEDLYKIWANPRVANYMNIEPFTTANQALAMIRVINDAPYALRYSVLLENEIIGSAGFNDMNGASGVVEIGYDLAEHYWRRGFGTEIVRALLTEATHHHYTEVHAKIAPHNEGSIKLVEKLAFTYQATFEEEGQQVALYTKKLQ